MMKNNVIKLLILTSVLTCMVTGCNSDNSNIQDSISTSEDAEETNSEPVSENEESAVLLPDGYRTYKIQAVLEDTTDEDITGYINSNIIKGIPKNDPCGTGDIVTIDYTISLKSDTDSTPESDEFQFTIGSGETLEEIENNVTGMKPGESKEFDIVYPEYMGNELSGKDAHVSLTVISVLSPTTYEELTEDQLTQITDYKSKDALWSAAKSELVKQNQEQYNEQVAIEIIDYLVSNSHITSVDQEALENYTKAYEASLDNVCRKNAGKSYKEYLQETDSVTDYEYTRLLNDDAYKSYTQLLIMNAVAGENNISISDDDMKQSVTALYENYGMDSENDFITLFGAETCKMFAEQDKVIDFMKKICS